MRIKFNWRTVLYWKLLRRSRIFNSWYKRFLSEILFDIQLLDLDMADIEKKYEAKLERAKNYKAAIK